MDPQQKKVVLKEMEDLIFNQKKTLSQNFVCKHFKIHISKVPELMNEFVSKHKKDKLEIEYLLSGHDDNDDSDQVKLQKYSIVDADELESAKEQFNNPECEIYSICAEGHYESFLNFEQFICEPNVDDFKELQKLTYIDNPNIKIRPGRRGASSESSTNKNNNKLNSTLKVEPKKIETKPEPMEIEESSIVPSPKRKSTPKDETSKRFKRVRVLDSSDDEDEKSNVKENCKVEENGEFTVTTLVAKEEDAPLPVPKDISPVEKKQLNPQQNGKQNSSRKSKAPEKQRSITSFFTKMAPKK